jgi:hypothetical protein
MITSAKSLVARTALGFAALVGLAAAVPASAHPYGDYGRQERGHDREWVQRDYRPDGYGYARQWRPAPVWYGYHAHDGRFAQRDYRDGYRHDDRRDGRYDGRYDGRHDDGRGFWRGR